MKILLKIKSLIHADQITSISLLYILVIILLMISRNISLTPDRIFLVLALIALIFGKGKLFFKDWVPFLALFLGYEVLRGFADLYKTPSYTFLINADKALTGIIPTIKLQELFYQSNKISWYDNLGVFLYFMHFINPLIVAFVLWWKDRKKYWIFVIGLLILSYSSFIFFILFPTAPPWMASQNNYLPQVHKIINETLGKNEINYSISFLYQKLNPNPVAAFPSLHAAFPWYIALTLLQTNIY